jgi:hypothetical protein
MNASVGSKNDARWEKPCCRWDPWRDGEGGQGFKPETPARACPRGGELSGVEVNVVIRGGFVRSGIEWEKGRQINSEREADSEREVFSEANEIRIR